MTRFGGPRPPAHRGLMRIIPLRTFAVLLPLACSSTPPDSDPFGSGTATDAGSGPAATSDDSPEGTSDEPGATSGATGPSEESSSDGGATPKLDVAGGGDVPPPGNCVGDDDCGCTSVDLLFVIDNSGSMGDYQDALAIAFTSFAETLSTTLPPATNVHVAVTSTEMGYSSAGNTSINNGMCAFEGEDGLTNVDYYVTPIDEDSGRNGAQGRLYDPGGGQPFVSFDTGGDLAQAEAWFASAVTIGEGGSNIEMATAPVGWVFDSANAASNDGFLRDAGSVLVVFFMQDEPDQTPAMIEGSAAGPWVLERVAEAKQNCGGLDCVITGGFLAENACSADGNLPLDDFLAGVGGTPVVAALPFFAGDAQTLANDMNNLLSTTLADVIAQTCEEIQPEG